MAIEHRFNTEKIENDKIHHYKFSIEKNQDKGGSWLATYTVVNRMGALVRLSAEAFSSVAPAKRWCANKINRKSLRWDVTEDKKSMSTVVDVKVVQAL